MAGIQVIDPSTFDLSGTIGKMGQDLSIIADPQGHRLAQLRELFIQNPKVAESAATMFKINPDAASKFFGVKSDAFAPMIQAVTPDPIALATHTFLNTPGAVESLSDMFTQSPMSLVNPELAASQEVTKRTQENAAATTARQIEVQNLRDAAAAERAKAQQDAAMARVNAQQAGADRRVQARPPSAATTPKSPLTGKTRAQEVDDIQQRKGKLGSLIAELQALTPKTTIQAGKAKRIEPVAEYSKRTVAKIRQIQKEASEARRLYPSEEWTAATTAPISLELNDKGEPEPIGYKIVTFPATAAPTPVVATPTTVAPLVDDQKFTMIDEAIQSGKMDYQLLLTDPEFPNLPDSVKQRLKDKYSK